MSLHGHSDQINSLAMSPQGQTLASGSQVGDSYHLVRALARSDTIWCRCQDGTICIWSAYTGELMGKLEGHAGPVFSVDFNPLEERRLSSGGADNLVKIWDSVEMTERQEIPPCSTTIFAGLPLFFGWLFPRVVARLSPFLTCVMSFTSASRMLTPA